MIRVRSLVKKALESLLGVRIYRTLPRGVDPFVDLQRVIHGWEPEVIFDVGANVGQSALSYASRFPKCRVFSFEPCRETYAKLAENVRQFPNVECHALAMAARVGTAVLRYGQQSDLHRLVSEAHARRLLEDKQGELVEVTTVDVFCRQRRISRVNYLKIDTEGCDREVLRGSEDCLVSHRVDVIETELGFYRDNDVHVMFDDVRRYLEERGYFVFGLYEQVHEWKCRRAHLRRANVVFVSGEVDALAGRLRGSG